MCVVLLKSQGGPVGTHIFPTEQISNCNFSSSYIVSKLTPLQVDFVSYMDDIAGEIGVRPSLPWLFFTDYPLFKKVLWGPVTAYQYRLKGPGKWDGARRAIFTQFDRMYQALKTRKVSNTHLMFVLQCCHAELNVKLTFVSDSFRWTNLKCPWLAA